MTVVTPPRGDAANILAAQVGRYHPLVTPPHVAIMRDTPGADTAEYADFVSYYRFRLSI